MLQSYESFAKYYLQLNYTVASVIFRIERFPDQYKIFKNSFLCKFRADLKCVIEFDLQVRFQERFDITLHQIDFKFSTTKQLWLTAQGTLT